MTDQRLKVIIADNSFQLFSIFLGDIQVDREIIFYIKNYYLR